MNGTRHRSMVERLAFITAVAFVAGASLSSSSTAQTPELANAGLGENPPVAPQPARTAPQQTESAHYTSFEEAEQFPAGCLDDLLAGQPLEGRCTAIATSSQCRERSGRRNRRCVSQVELVIEGSNPRLTPLDTNCHDVGVVNRISPHRGPDLELEASGRWCLTPSANFLTATASCRRVFSNGEVMEAVGEFKGVLVGSNPALGTGPALSAFHYDIFLPGPEF